MYRAASRTICTGKLPILVEMEKPCDRLRQARQEARYTSVAEAARRFHWNENTYKSHENGTRGFDADQARDYGRAFHVSAGWLMTGEGKKEEMPSPEEMSLILKFRKMTPENRRVYLQMADLFADQATMQLDPDQAPKRGRQ